MAAAAHEACGMHGILHFQLLAACVLRSGAGCGLEQPLDMSNMTCADICCTSSAFVLQSATRRVLQE
jgi:hypothetical protein